MFRTSLNIQNGDILDGVMKISNIFNFLRFNPILIKVASKCMICPVLFFTNLVFPLTHLCLASHKRDWQTVQIKIRPRCTVWSKYGNFYKTTIIKISQTPFLLKMDWSKDLRWKRPLCINGLSRMETFLEEAALTKYLFLPSEKGSTLKGKNLQYWILYQWIYTLHLMPFQNGGKNKWQSYLSMIVYMHPFPYRKNVSFDS